MHHIIFVPSVGFQYRTYRTYQGNDFTSPIIARGISVPEFIPDGPASAGWGWDTVYGIIRFDMSIRLAGWLDG